MALQAMTFSSFEMKTFTLDAAFNGYETNASIRNHSDSLEYIIYFEVTFASDDQNFLTFHQLLSPGVFFPFQTIFTIERLSLRPPPY